MITYPDKMIRGISNKDFFDSDGRASAALFQFGDTVRDDGYVEASINWFDDDLSLDSILKQKKEDGSYQFKAGAAIIPRDWIDSLMNKPTGKGILNYERAPLPDNSYHGNLLRKDSAISKQIKTVIAASIAMGVEEIVRRT